LDHLHEKLISEKPEQDTNLLRIMDEHRETLATHKDFAEEYLSALTQLELSKEQLSVIDHKTFAEMKAMKRPPKVLSDLLTGICMLFGMSKPNWREAASFICGRDMRNKLLNFDPKHLDPKARAAATKFIMANEESFDPDRVEEVNKKAVSLADWVEGLNGLLEVYAKLEQYPDGEKILKEIETAYSELKKNKALVAKMVHRDNCWQNVIDQVKWNIDILKMCENTQVRITTRRTKMIKCLEDYDTLPEFADTILPEGYMEPYNLACKKIRTQFGELTELEFRFVFSVVKKYFTSLIRVYKTYSSFEGKNRQGLSGMASTVWRTCCKSMELPNVIEDEAQDYINSIFNLSSVQTMESNRHSVDFATLRTERGKQVEMKVNNEITGVWQQGETTTHLWTLEAKLGGVFAGFIGSEKYATVEGDFGDENDLSFKVAWGKDSNKSKLVAKCKAKWVDPVTIRVRYVLSNKKKGYWVLQKTGAKVRTQNKGTPWLYYDSFVEAVIRLSIFIWEDLPAWEAIEELMEKHIVPKALSSWNVLPESNDTVLNYLHEKDVRSTLAAIFKSYSSQRRDKKGKLMTYPKWEELVRKINRNATRGCESATIRQMQFSFFASKEMFPQDGPLDELTFMEFNYAVARLAFLMVVNTKTKRGAKVTKPQLSQQVKTMMAWLTDVRRR